MPPIDIRADVKMTPAEARSDLAQRSDAPCILCDWYKISLEDGRNHRNDFPRTPTRSPVPAPPPSPAP